MEISLIMYDCLLCSQCEKWENEMIGGEMCSALCSHKEAYLYSCVGDTRNQKVSHQFLDYRLHLYCQHLIL